MTIEMFMILLFIASVLSSLITEAIKKMMSGTSSNIIVAIISAFVGGGIGSAYYIAVAPHMTGSELTMFITALVIGSWLCAMLGYDKVKQAILQIKIPKINYGKSITKPVDDIEEKSIQIDIGIPDHIPLYGRQLYEKKEH